MINREAAYAALFTQLAGLPGIRTSSRGLKPWAQVSATDQPALFLTQGRQIALQTPDNMPRRWKLLADVFVYVRNDDPAGELPCVTLNGILDAIEAALAPAPALERQTLNDVVEHCRIAGEIETDEGVLGPQAVAIIPIEIYPTPL